MVAERADSGFGRGRGGRVPRRGGRCVDWPLEHLDARCTTPIPSSAREKYASGCLAAASWTSCGLPVGRNAVRPCKVRRPRSPRPLRLCVLSESSLGCSTAWLSSSSLPLLASCACVTAHRPLCVASQRESDLTGNPFPPPAYTLGLQIRHRHSYKASLHPPSYPST